MSGLQLRQCCTVDDAALLAKSNMTAFMGEKWWSILWPTTPLDDVIQACTERMPKNLLTEREVRRHQHVVDTATSDIVGYARWILPTSHQDAWLEAQTPDVSQADRKRFEEQHAKAKWEPRDIPNMDDAIHVMQAKHEPKRPFIKLDYLGVRPDYRRRGVASMLVKSGVEQADKLGVDVFLVAMGRKAVAMYERNGFEVLDEAIQELDQWGGNEGELYETFSVIKRFSP